MIRRSYKFLDGDSLKRLFIALVRPHLEYSNAVWSPRYIKDKKLMERVQRRATKLIPDLKELPYETRLKKLQLPSLYYRRGDMIEVYKYMYNIYDVDTSSLLDRDQDSHTRGHPYKLKKVYCRTETRHAFFSLRVVDTWNGLPERVVTAPSLNSFKNRLDKVWTSYRYKTDIRFPLPPDNKLSLNDITKVMITKTS